MDPAAEIAKLTSASRDGETGGGSGEEDGDGGYEEKVPEACAWRTDKMEKLRAEVASTKAAIEDFKGPM